MYGAYGSAQTECALHHASPQCRQPIMRRHRIDDIADSLAQARQYSPVFRVQLMDLRMILSQSLLPRAMGQT